jgi:hypothetical protein
MISYPYFRKFLPLENGQKLLLRLVNYQDADYLVRLARESRAKGGAFGGVGQEIDQLLKNLTAAIPLNYLKLLPLAAVDLERHCFAGCGFLTRGGYPTPHVGEISLRVSRTYLGLKVEALLLRELIRLAIKDELAVLKARVPLEEDQALRSFKEQGFELEAILRDFTSDRKKPDRKVLIMLRPLLNKGGKGIVLTSLY